MTHETTTKLTDIEKVQSTDFHALVNSRFLALKNGFLSEVIKKDNILIYRSKGGDPKISLNFEAQDMYGQPVVCRHLSGAFLTFHNDKSIHDMLGSKDAIEAIDDIRTNAFDNNFVMMKGNHYFMFDAKHFGEMLYHVKQSVLEGESKSFLLITNIHAMTIVIRVKNGISIIKFYDPNFTNVYLRAIITDDSSIAHLHIEDFIDKRLLEIYQVHLFALTLVAYHNIANKSKIIAKIDSPFNKIASLLDFFPKQTLKYLRDTEFEMTISENNMKQIYIILSDENLTSNIYTHLFFLIFNNIFDSTIIENHKLILIRRLQTANDAVFKKLLHSTDKIAKQHLNFIICSTVIDNSKKISLLLDQNYILENILLSALLYQNKEMASYVFEHVTSDTTLSITEKLSLLKAPYKDKPMLEHFAVRPQLSPTQLDAAKLYLETVLGCTSLSIMHKLKLLLATNDKGQSVIALAHQHGQQQLLDIYHDVIEAADKLSRSEKALLQHQLTPKPDASQASVTGFSSFFASISHSAPSQPPKVASTLALPSLGY